MKQINEHLWVQELDLGIFDLRGSLILGRDRALIWDTLSHPRDMAPYLPLIGDREIWVAYSHADWDHIWGTDGLDRAPAAIVSHTLCAPRFESETHEKLAAMQRETPGKWEAVKLVPPDLTFDKEMAIDLGGINVQLRHLPGHTEDSLIALIPETGVALMADTIESPLPVVPKKSPIKEWIDGLQQVANDASFHTVIPCHGQMGDRQLIVDCIDYLQKLLDGEAMEVSDSLSEFYRATHLANLQWRD
jgi:glyoxylase-like metal-dependent hydrolase (beta-lactamase superfamily II)